MESKAKAEDRGTEYYKGLLASSLRTDNGASGNGGLLAVLRQGAAVLTRRLT